MSDSDTEDKMGRDNADAHKAPGDPTKHDMSVDRKNEHISKKVYMFPEAYNALRRELEENFPNLWKFVQGPMAYDAQRFINAMNEALDMVVQFDSGNVDGICKQFLDALRKKRGLLPLHNPGEYYHNVQMEEQVRLAREDQENPWKLH